LKPDIQLNDWFDARAAQRAVGRCSSMRTSFSWRLIVQVWAGLLALGLALWFTITYAGLILEVMGVLSGALLVSLAIYPLADFLACWRVPRGLTVLGVYVGLVVVLMLLGGF
jgi:predicted PurR-regulated permease PerM